MSESKRQTDPVEAPSGGAVPKAEPNQSPNCPECGAALPRDALAEAAQVCTACGHHMYLSVDARLALLLDDVEYVAHDTAITALDPLGFVDSKPYPERVAKSRESIGRNEAFLAVTGRLGGVLVEVGIFEFKFLGGSMGSVVGEMIVRLFERAAESDRPVVIVVASGGARMQEGLLSLMQMAKTCAALARFRERVRKPYITLLTHPTTGGVAASFAMLGDVVLAEPKALIGFAGPRVIQQTIGVELPEGFQRSEYLVEHGMIDRIVPRCDQRRTLIVLLRQLMGLAPLADRA